MLIFPRLIPHLLAIVFIIGLSFQETIITMVLQILCPSLIILDFLKMPHFHYRSSYPAKTWRLILWAWVPLHILLVLKCLEFVSNPSKNMIEVIIFSGFVGLFLGTLGIPIAHELLHHKHRFERYLSEILMSLFSYTHFCIEHIEGHHRNVCTVLDPVSSINKRNFYFHYPHALVGGLLDAWDIESKRLTRYQLRTFSIRNRMVKYGCILLSIYTSIYLIYGFSGIVFFIIQSIAGFSLLELINYIQHYGLTRQKDGSGKYEKVKCIHSWDSNHIATNYMLFNLGYHADHHCNPFHSYEMLKHMRTSPQLPVGYFVAIWICLMPPLWRYVTDEHSKVCQSR